MSLVLSTPRVVGGRDVVAIVTKCEVACGEELCYDYNMQQHATEMGLDAAGLDTHLCQCGAPKCESREFKAGCVCAGAMQNFVLGQARWH